MLQSKTWDKKLIELISEGYLIGTAFILFLLILLISQSGNCQLSQTKSCGAASNVSITGSTSQWNNSSNVYSSDNIYASLVSNLAGSGSYTDYLQLSNFNFSVPTGCIINGIKVFIERADANGKSKDYRARIVKNGLIRTIDKALNPSWPGTDNIQSYGGTSDLWGETLTPADINSLYFGFAFAAQRTGGGPQITLAKIDHIYITVYYSVLLPIELEYFNADISGEFVKLSWKTSTELNNEFFTIEKSADGIQFIELKKIPGAGYSTNEINYSCTDENPLNGTSYYRLKQTDSDGINTYSELKSIERIADTDVLFFPNPFQNNLTLKYHSEKPLIIDITIFNTIGKKLFETRSKVNSGMNYIELNNLKLLPGTYSISVFENQQLIINSTLIHVI